MRVGVVDADMVGRRRHKFPNLACMKLSGFHKGLGDDVSLLGSYEGLDSFDRVYVSKVFLETAVPEAVLAAPNVVRGGTGFFPEGSPGLPAEVEHHFPDYHLYDSWVADCLAAGTKPAWFSDYREVSLGFMTRGCPRKCGFCVNRLVKGGAVAHSPLGEFLDPARKRIALCDDNVLAYAGWRDVFGELAAAGKRFSFRQGLDVRMLTPEKAEALVASLHEYPVTFAFDDYAERAVVEERLALWAGMRRRRYNALVYLLCAYKSADLADVVEVFERVRVLMRHRCLPYLMRHGKYQESPYRGMYIALASWCNQQSVFVTRTLREFGRWWPEKMGRRSAYTRYLEEFEADHPDVAREFYDMRFPQGGVKAPVAQLE